MGVIPNAMCTECARWEWDKFGVEGELRLRPLVDAERVGNELDVDVDGIGRPAMSGGGGGGWEENVLWIVGEEEEEPARLERLGGGGKLSGG
jgi:hypothetical protein